MLKLMIVDDEPIILDGIRSMIEQEKTLFTKIVTAYDGIEALEKMDYFQPDLIITDIHMPELNGLELIRKAQKKNVARFIILSGYDVFEYARKAIQLHVAEYLLKPVNQQELTDILKRIVIELMEERQLESGAERDQDQHSAELNDNVKMLKDYIGSNYMKDISLSDVAEYLNLHPSYVGQIFKKETGDTFVNYINNLRIDKAKELLVGMPNTSLEKISRCVGYENHRTFYKVFRKYVGQTPGQYREHFKQN
ncbi:response regulator [Cohnella sp.]|uniref:response regulator transcription factor n=1 Tax=Cohnella sp. TaxID=1883426 RepID=UPI0035630210